ncbi:MAG: dynamin family protein [Pseudomonadota bacterium]
MAIARQSVESNVLEFVRRGLPTDTIETEVLAVQAELRDLLTQLEQLVVPEKVEVMSKLGEMFERFVVQVSLIGQVKAGKTALCNALLGESQLLPSDINPWTSVVTSVHLNQSAPRNKHAVFRFFTQDEWDTMVDTGGRIASMANEAEMDTEVEELRAQITDMQRKTEKRLGKNFELLLGNQHAFSGFTPDLIRRYVCLGEDGAENDPEGRFADMTRSADLYLESELFNYPVTFIDTPGVNDPFLVREAMTLESLGKSDICVIVLSAHQALSTSDLALMRILLNLKQHQMVLFINRIDELANPVEQVREIRGRIQETLKAQKLPLDVPIVFGSASWGEAHITKSTDVLTEPSIETLSSIADQQIDNGPVDLSGMTELQSVLNRKAIVEICAPFFEDIINMATALAQQSRGLLGKATSTPEALPIAVDIDQINADIDRLRRDVAEQIDEITAASAKQSRLSFGGAFHEFIFKESRQLVRHLEEGGGVGSWTFDTDKLRRSLNEFYQGNTADMEAEFQSLSRTIFNHMVKLYEMCGEHDPEGLGLSLPILPEPATPVPLMRTMSIDVSGNWLSNWLARKLRRQSYLKKFRDVTSEQMKATIVEIEETGILAFADAAKEQILSFIESNQFAIQEMVGLDDQDRREEYRTNIEKTGTLEGRVDQLTTLVSKLNGLNLRLQQIS